MLDVTDSHISVLLKIKFYRRMPYWLKYVLMTNDTLQYDALYTQRQIDQ